MNEFRNAIIAANLTAMGDDAKEKVIEEILKYRPVKIVVTILLWMLLVVALLSFAIHIAKCSNNKNTKLFWGMWECSECKVIDSTRHDTTVVKVHDTVTIKVPETSKEHKNQGGISQKGNNDKAYQNNGTNNGIIGDNGTLNQFGPIQPHPTSENLQGLEKLFPDKGKTFTIRYNGGSRLSQVFAGELRILMLSNGYKEVNLSAVMGDYAYEKGISLVQGLYGVYIQAE